MAISEQLIHLKELPSLPALLIEALQQLADAPDFQQLADKIAQDPPTAARILRLANSPFYGMSRDIGSLREAIVVLGVNHIRNLLVSICFAKIAPTRHKDFDYLWFWSHSMAVADCARQLAQRNGMDSELAFSAALFHDIGLLVIALLLPEHYSRIFQNPSPNQLERERRELGFDHAYIGGQVAHYWHLPVAIQQAIEQHETPPNPNSELSVNTLIYLSNFLIKSLSTPEADAGAGFPDDITAILESLALSLDQAEDLANTSRQFADLIVSIL